VGRRQQGDPVRIELQRWYLEVRNKVPWVKSGLFDLVDSDCNEHSFCVTVYALSTVGGQQYFSKKQVGNAAEVVSWMEIREAVCVTSHVSFATSFLRRLSKNGDLADIACVQLFRWLVWSWCVESALVQCVIWKTSTSPWTIQCTTMGMLRLARRVDKAVYLWMVPEITGSDRSNVPSKASMSSDRRSQS
jgi:hypothetical protein